MKKILFLIDNLGSGGAQRQVATIAPLLKEAGCDVEVLCYHGNDFFAQKLIDNSIKIHWITPKSFIARVFKIRRFIRRGRYDAVVSFLDTPDFLNCLAAIGGRSWRVITSERSAKEDFFLSHKGKIFGWFRRYSDTIVCNSENARQLWLKYYPQYEDKLKVIYNIVDINEIDSTYIPRRDDKTHIIVAASYQYLKNPINVVKAILNLSAKYKRQLKLDWYGRCEVTVGETRAYDEAQKLVEDNKLQNIVSLNDSTNLISEKMNEADVVGLFSKYEGLPNTICEGMSLSKPVIMSRVSDYPVFVSDNNGVLCDWDNTQSITDGIKQLIDMPLDQLLKLGRNSKEKSDILFDKKGNLLKWQELVDKKYNEK